MRRFYAGLAGRVFVLFILVVAAVPASQAARLHAPAYWTVSRGEATVYLFGSIHLMTRQTPWFTPRLQRLFAAADDATFEMTPEQSSAAVLGPLVREMGLYQPGDSLKNHMPPAVYASLGKVLAGLGLAPSAYDRLKPWLASVTLATQVAAAHGFSPDYGIDKTLGDQAVAIGKPVFGLETARQQLSLFAGLSPAVQLDLFEETLDELQDVQSLFGKMRDAWLGADLAGLEVVLNQTMTPGLAEALLYARNRAWLPHIVALLQKPGVHFVTVGAGHLVGDKSLLALLRAKGFTVVRGAR
jgi:uncharacterized protein YbaP (TraB family)